MSDDDDWSAAEDELLERLLAVQHMKAVGAQSHQLFEAAPKEVAEFRHALIAETDRACALHAASFLDEALECLLRSGFVEDDDATRAMFKGTGALATFSARIELAYLRGFLSADARRELGLIRKIRNAFAHHAGHLRFTHPPIASRCRELELHTTEQSSARARFCSSVLAVLGQIHGVQKTLVRPTPPPDLDRAFIRRTVSALFAAVASKGGEKKPAQ